ncbi:MAG: hypothetical protein Q4P18_07210 [Methanobrevibacter sp.]|uniref:hypothetical protein n=1 Tax=Methanobrevibacter sp. TaxID=66852 RepID=UPI0026DF3960|nr:hypothetical protein [Methanobrevibacter sp.]MDO5849306.1 hypothetical protein [Methanobrevibacter sp.]
MIFLINEDELKDLLESKGITIEDDAFENLLKTIKADIVKTIGIPLQPTEKIQFEKTFSGLTLVADYYPIYEVNSLTINGNEISENDFTINSQEGIIYLDIPHNGFLKLEYTYCITDEQYSNLILPLILDMLEYSLDSAWDKNAASISEGDVSISLDTSLGKGSLIQKQLENLKEEFSTVGRMI